VTEPAATSTAAAAREEEALCARAQAAVGEAVSPARR
jgi:hypothetical protein